MIGKTINEISVGEGASFTKTITEADVYIYAGVTGDFNPVHINKDYASKTFFKARVAHGLLSAGLISAVLGTRFPGPGTIYIRQELHFRAPVFIGDTIKATVEVTKMDIEKNRIVLKTTCQSQENIVVLDGEAIVSPPEPPGEQ